GHNFDIRKNLLGYDDVMNMQREVIYKQRSQVLEGENLREEVSGMIKDVVFTATENHLAGVEEDYEEALKKLIIYLDEICIPSNRVTIDDLLNLEIEEVKEKLLTIAAEIYAGKELEFGEERIREIERVVLLKSVDMKWMDHIDAMDHLKQGIGLRAFKQVDPVQAYQMEGSEMFEEMIESIKVDTVKYLFHVQLEKAPERERVVEKTTEVHQNVSSNGSEEPKKKEPVRKEVVAGRNDKCPCGSGKKFKNCCGREV
ncbi:MAG: SEC-C metal-binding domain-containing protein, partial [Clostridium sp.]|uniref:SEC-C metal-binding domain-containing protein n=1 Tax=Clostridium sp. TaxID=1506 RepID=UPI003F39259F